MAADLGLIGSPAKAMSILLKANPTRVSVGRIHFRDTDGVSRSRYFTVAAGVGADALLMSRLDVRLKRRLGYLLYMIEATRIIFTHGFPLFEAWFQAEETAIRGCWKRRNCWPCAFARLGSAPEPGARSEPAQWQSDHPRIQDANRFRYILFMLAVLAQRHTFAREVELVETPTIECRPRNGSKEELFVEADGEVLGMLPVKT